LENSRSKRGDVLDLQELEAVLEHMETLQTMRESLREQQFQIILELSVELQDIILGKKKPLDPRPRQTPTKAKRSEERRVESKIHKRPHQRHGRFKHNRRTYPGTNQRQVRTTQLSSQGLQELEP
jgi:hypothetical protein